MGSSGIQWSLWANEQALASLLLILMGVIVSFSAISLFTYSGVAIFLAITLPFLFILEWPRSRLKGKARTVLRPFQSVLHVIYETRFGSLASDYFFRSFLLFIIAVPGLFSIATAIGALSLALSAVLYFLAAWNGERWDCPEEDKPIIAGPSAPPPDPRLLPDGRPFEVSEPMPAPNLQ